ncbi:MAG TPA: D-aminoacyl-tRNA deacylase [Saprospiraceae bacterium]|nr:D-aminoacyl-tRNA deacylase [Saprospiraceae bacterium]
MRCVIQRVIKASVRIDSEAYSAIGRGLLLLLGIEDQDHDEDLEWLAGKVAQLRIFADDEQLMNRSVQDIDGELLVVSQFTLFASTKKGNRPGFTRAAQPAYADQKYQEFVKLLERLTGKPVQTGRFGADMQIELINDGPVTIVMDTKNRE